MISVGDFCLADKQKPFLSFGFVRIPAEMIVYTQKDSPPNHGPGDIYPTKTLPDNPSVTQSEKLFPCHHDSGGNDVNSSNNNTETILIGLCEGVN